MLQLQGRGRGALHLGLQQGSQGAGSHLHHPQELLGRWQSPRACGRVEAGRTGAWGAVGRREARETAQQGVAAVGVQGTEGDPLGDGQAGALHLPGVHWDPPRQQ